MKAIIRLPLTYLMAAFLLAGSALWSEEKLEKLIANEKENPSDWKIPYQIGQIFKHKKKSCSSALPHYERALEKSGHREIRLIVEAGSCQLALGDPQGALAHMEKFLSLGGKPESPVARGYTARLFFQNGMPDKALEYADKGTSLYNKLSPKVFRLEWKLALAYEMNRGKRKADTVLRLTLPFEAPYQHLASWSIQSANPAEQSWMSVAQQPIVFGENQYAELRRIGPAWPEEIVLTLEVHQTPYSIFSHGRPEVLAATDVNSPFFDAANLNPRNMFSLSEPEFQAMGVTAIEGASSNTDKLRNIMNYVRRHMKYAPRKVKSSEGALAILKSGQGDCYFYTLTAMGLARTQHLAVRSLYGVTFNNQGSTHVILEAYDANRAEWFPVDPQASAYFGRINAMYVPFSRHPQSHGVRRFDGILHIDTPFLRKQAGKLRPLAISVSVDGQVIHSSGRAMNDSEASEFDRKVIEPVYEIEPGSE